MRLYRCGCECFGASPAVFAAPGAGGASAPPPKSGGPVSRAVLEDLAAASRILAAQGVVDGFGHVSLAIPMRRTVS